MTLSVPLGRWVALALFVALCWLAIEFVVSPVLSFLEDSRVSIARSQAILKRMDEIEALVPTLKADLAKLNSSPVEQALLRDASPSQSEAEIQATAQKLVSASGATPRNSKTSLRTSEGALDRIGVVIDLTATPQMLSALLHAAEAAEPAIFVDHLAIDAAESGAGPKSPDGQPLLNVTMRLNRYSRPTATRTK